MAAQLICNQWVAGSTPVTSSKNKRTDDTFNSPVRFFFEIAQKHLRMCYKRTNKLRNRGFNFCLDGNKCAGTVGSL